MASHPTRTVAVIGAGMAGAACAHGLALAGHAVHVFDKSQGPGGRMATRRFQWVERGGQAGSTRLDHGAVGITARTSAFKAFLADAIRVGDLAPWMPSMAEGSLPLEAGEQLYLPLPDMPALCRRLLAGIPATWSFAADALHRSELGWEIEAGDWIDRCVAVSDSTPALGRCVVLWSLCGSHDVDRHAAATCATWDGGHRAYQRGQGGAGHFAG